jgi:hypothetical protein
MTHAGPSSPFGGKCCTRTRHGGLLYFVGCLTAQSAREWGHCSSYSASKFRFTPNFSVVTFALISIALYYGSGKTNGPREWATNRCICVPLLQQLHQDCRGFGYAPWDWSHSRAVTRHLFVNTVTPPLQYCASCWNDRVMTNNVKVSLWHFAQHHGRCHGNVKRHGIPPMVQVFTVLYNSISFISSSSRFIFVVVLWALLARMQPILLRFLTRYSLLGLLSFLPGVRPL